MYNEVEIGFACVPEFEGYKSLRWGIQLPEIPTPIRIRTALITPYTCSDKLPLGTGVITVSRAVHSIINGLVVILFVGPEACSKLETSRELSVWIQT